MYLCTKVKRVRMLSYIECIQMNTCRTRDATTSKCNLDLNYGQRFSTQALHMNILHSAKQKHSIE